MSVFVLVCITLCPFYSFAIILTRKREQFALLLLSFGCLVTVNVLWLILTVPWVGLQCVTVVLMDLPNNNSLRSRTILRLGLANLYEIKNETVTINRNLSNNQVHRLSHNYHAAAICLKE